MYNKQTVINKRKKLMIKILHDEIMKCDYTNDPVWERLVELGRQHLSLKDALQIVEKEFDENGTPLSTHKK